MQLDPGDIIEQKYEILRVLGKGGMGAVYEATNPRVGRRVAIKVMHQAIDPRAIARFEREARATQIGSPHIVQVYDLGYLEDGAPYMVMEYLSGESLGARLARKGRLRPAELLPIVKEVLEALGAAHRAGIVHRDLKPDNVFLARPEGETRELVKLVDFGISKAIEGSSSADAETLTRAGVAVGTPHYMSPEQIQGAKTLDGRSDLYALGVLLYRCLSGALPFQGEDVTALLVAILLETPKPLRELAPDVDPELAAIVGRAMTRRVDERYQTAAEFSSDLTRWQSGAGAGSDSEPLPLEPTAATLTSLAGTASSFATSTAASQARRHRNWRTGLVVLACSSAALVALLFGTRKFTELGRAPATLERTPAPGSQPVAVQQAPVSRASGTQAPAAVASTASESPEAASAASAVHQLPPPHASATPKKRERPAGTRVPTESRAKSEQSGASNTGRHLLGDL